MDVSDESDAIPYPIVNISGVDDWQRIRGITRGHLTENEARKLYEQFEDSVRCVVVEHDYIDKDYRDTYARFYAKKFADYPSRTFRLHLFAKSITATQLWDGHHLQESYIGSIIVRPTRASSIGRTLIDPARCARISGEICTAPFDIHLLGARLTIQAFPFMSQDADVTRCAHVACWSIFRYFSQQFRRCREVWPYELSELTSNYAFGRLIPSKGMAVAQVCEMFGNGGFAPEVYYRTNLERLHFGRNNFERLIYSCVESSIPLVASLQSKEHALTIIGHISEYNAPPDGIDVQADCLRALIVHDDNEAPYQYLPVNPADRQFCHPNGYSLRDVSAIVVPLSDKNHFPPDAILEYAWSQLEHEERKFAFGTDDDVDVDSLILRPFLVTNRRFQSFRRRTMPHPLSRLYASWPLHQFVWVVELSTSDLLAERKIIGEIIIDGTASEFDDDAYTVLHYPKRLFLHNRRNGERLERLLDYKGPYPAFKDNLLEA